MQVTKDASYDLEISFGTAPVQIVASDVLKASRENIICKAGTNVKRLDLTNREAWDQFPKAWTLGVRSSLAEAPGTLNPSCYNL